jgi:hypothetical protein
MKYLYAILPTPTGSEFEPLAFASPTGKFETITDGALAVVTSDSTIESFADLARGDLMRYLALHQRAVETLMAVTPVLPVKFGTLLSDVEQVRTVLYLGRAEFQQASTFVGDRHEVDVAVTWDPQRVFGEIAAMPEIAAVRDQIATLPPERVLSGRVTLGRLVKELFDNHRNQVRDALVSELSAHAHRWRLNPVMDESMVMNVACLVNAAEEESLEDTVYALDERYQGQFNFRLIGPLPPYSFATVEARAINRTDMTQACELLMLQTCDCTPDQVKHAYYEQARRYHPDAVGDDPVARNQFVRLTQAYKLMTEIAQRVPAGAFGHNGSPYILVKVGGPEA